MTDYEAAFWKLKNNWHESVRHYEERIEKLEAALIALKAMHHEGGIDDIVERDDRTYLMVCNALEELQ